MTSKSITIRHNFSGGWATDVGPNVDNGIDQNGVINIPFLLDAKNIVYELDGGPRKKGGVAKLNTAALESGASVRGIADYWRMGTGGTPAQKRVIHVGSKIKADAADGVFADISTGISTSSVPSYCAAQDVLIIADDSGSAPLVYDQTTVAALGGTPPAFQFCAYHKNRAWASGVLANPSRLYYSALDNVQDWVGAGSGTIDIDIDDGDKITGLVSHKNSLFVFKGPYKGSIHQITGSAPTGTDAFARKPFINGIGAVWHNSIFKYGDDIGFITPDGSVHSLTVTAEFGDFRQAALSWPINRYIAGRVNRNNLKKAWAVSNTIDGIVLITIPVDGSTTNNLTLMMDYRFEKPRWSYWDDIANICLANVVDPGDSNRMRIMSGHSDGYVRKQFQTSRSIDGSTGINMSIKTPYMNYATPYNLKTLNILGLGVRSTGGSYTLTWNGNVSGQSQNASIAGAVGTLLGDFLLDTSVLGGDTNQDIFYDAVTGGEFRQIQYQISHAANQTDAELHSITANVKVGAFSTET